jgi:hypothetical protein
LKHEGNRNEKRIEIELIKEKGKKRIPQCPSWAQKITYRPSSLRVRWPNQTKCADMRGPVVSWTQPHALTRDLCSLSRSCSLDVGWAILSGFSLAPLWVWREARIAPTSTRISRQSSFLSLFLPATLIPGTDLES